MTVTNNWAVGLHVCGKYSVELGFGTCFESDVVTFSVANDFFHHGTHLVYFYRVYNEMLCVETVFFRRFLETGSRFFNAVVKNVGETKQHGSRDIACVEFVHQFFEVDFHTIFSRCYINVSLFVDVKIIDTPTVYIIKLGGIFNAPFFHLSVVFIFSIISLQILSIFSLVQRGDTSCLNMAWE